jgi:mannose-6-phosphate isomerase-like protein (cupin superfamily)
MASEPKYDKYSEPTGYDPGGYKTYRRPLTAFEKFMEEEGIPIYRGLGVYDMRQLSLGPWKRLGGRGIFICLDGLSGIRAQYLVEVPAAGALNPERHVYAEFMYVVEGRGSTEIWREGSAKRLMFEWQAGSLFHIPMNAHHRLVNASTSPALVLVANLAPPVMNIFQSRSFVFDNPYDFRDRYDESDNFFKPLRDVEREPVRGRAMVISNVFHDIAHCELPVDNIRAPGSRRFQARFPGYYYGADNSGFIQQYPPGRYTRAHCHEAWAVLVCLRGKGYTRNWHRSLGPRPWEDGKGHLVNRQDYTVGGLVAAAPGGGDWFHQHFGIASDTFRQLNLWAGTRASPSHGEEEPGHEHASQFQSIEEGGFTINYWEEDPFVRKEYEAELKREGVKFDMPESMYHRK